MAPYENQLIGSFLFALGYEGGRLNAGMMPANLFQQTPLDRAFSDLVVGSDLCLALEFKRTLHEVSSELRKWPREGLISFLGDKLLLATSHQAHLMVYGQESRGAVDLRMCLYADALRVGDVKLDRGSAHGLISHLYGNSKASDFRLGVPPVQLLSYLRKIATLKGASDGEHATERSAWLAAIRKNNRFFYLVAESLEQLLEPRRAIAREWRPDQKHDSDQERSLDEPRRGPSR